MIPLFPPNNYHQNFPCITKNLNLYEHGEKCGWMRTKLLALKNTALVRKVSSTVPLGKGCSSLFCSPSPGENDVWRVSLEWEHPSPEWHEAFAFNLIMILSLLLRALCCRCWVTNRNKKVWWIIRGPMLLYVLVRTAPTTLFPL